MTNPDDGGRETQVVTVRDRSIVIRQLVDTQMMLLAREAKILQREDVGMDRKLTGIDRMFRILESVVVQPADKEFLDDLMVAGELDLRELMSFATAFNDVTEGKAKVRRGRTPIKR